ncbi:SH3 domain-containing protein [Paracoccus sp. (in: a-proteobacteria)]|uniref:SH3 domain-containing protein n=1 Tax=Paracoccus sp. TaxID=267 RepID=UPI003A84F711
MIRLAFFTALTLAALFMALSVFGGEDLRSQRHVQVAGQRQDGMVLREILQAGEARLEAVPQEQPSDLVQAAVQTPQQVHRFPGPPLKPSPENAGQSPDRPAPVSTITSDVMYVTATRVNFRAGPSTDDPVIGALDHGAMVDVLGPDEAGWVNIRDAEGRSGYVSGRFLSELAP